jgi:hypothetical protein
MTVTSWCAFWLHFSSHRRQLRRRRRRLRKLEDSIFSPGQLGAQLIRRLKEAEEAEKIEFNEEQLLVMALMQMPDRLIANRLMTFTFAQLIRRLKEAEEAEKIEFNKEQRNLLSADPPDVTKTGKLRAPLASLFYIFYS